MKRLLTALLILCGMAFSVSAQIKFAITRTDGDQRRMEFEKYERLSEFYRQKGIVPTLIEYTTFISMKKGSLAQLKKDLNKYHVIQLLVDDEGVFNLTPEKAAYAKEAGKVLADYVKKGGSLIIHPRNVRYPGNDDEKYWNILFEPLGFRIESEGIADLENYIDHEYKTGFKKKFFHTKNIRKHDLTKGVRGLWFPFETFSVFPATPYITFQDPAWEVLIRGEKTTRSFKVDKKTNSLDLNTPGSCSKEPPLCAIRSFGKGRIAMVMSDRIWSGQNYGVPSWSHIVETKGIGDKHGDLMQLLLNLISWCAETAQKNPELGTYQPTTYKPIEFPEKVQWDDHKFQADTNNLVRGIIGAHSNFTDGKSTVKEYADAAKAAGLSFIVFTDPLEKSSPEKINALKEACKAVSNDDFYACPGVEFTDGSDIRWIFYGEKIVFPETKPFYKNGFKHVCWDGKIVKTWGRYATHCSHPPSAIINYNDLNKHGVVPENLWWFFNLIPYAYDHGKLIADNTKQWSFALKDLRRVIPISFTRITSADEVKQAADTAVTAVTKDGIRKLLNTRCSWYHGSKPYMPHVSYGKGTPVQIRNFALINDQKDPRTLQTKGTQRARGKFSVFSPNGLKEVRLYDAMRGLIGRFDAKGAKELVREMEFVHDRQYFLWLEADDLKGAKAISNYLLLFDYKQGLFRCGDNLNILGPLGYYWHPDRNEKLPLFKTFRNGEMFSVQGWDRGGPDCPVPHGETLNRARFEGIGEVLPGGVPKMHGIRMDVKLASGDLQIVDGVMDSFVEAFDNEFRPGPGYSSPAKKVEDNPYYTNVYRMYSPRDRMIHHIAWDHRRLYESLENYDGSYHLYEGEITFKQDLTFQKDAPLPFEVALFRTEPHAAAKLQDDLILVDDKDKGLTRINVKAGPRKQSHSGAIAKNGFAALIHSPIGYLGLIPVEGDFRYHYYNPGFMKIAVGTPGQSFKKGDKLRYAFICGDFVDQKRDGSKVRLAAEILRDNNYPVTMKVGKQIKRPLFFEVAADNYEVACKIGPKPGLGIDLPIRVKGLKDNGCIAVYSSQRKWFRFIGASTEGDVYLQEDIDKENDLWIGNIFLSDNDSLRLTFVMDGQEIGKRPFLEIHNPTHKEITAKVWSPANAPRFGGAAFQVTVPAGDSLRFDTRGRKIH